MNNFRLGAKAFLINNNKLLILKRRSDDIQRLWIWELLGGRLEIAENPIEGIKREVKEETGVDIEVLHPFKVRHFTREDNQIVTLLIFLCKTSDNEVIISKEHSNFEWVPLENCKDKSNDFFHQEVDIFNKLNLIKHV